MIHRERERKRETWIGNGLEAGGAVAELVPIQLVLADVGRVAYIISYHSMNVYVYVYRYVYVYI